MHLHHQNPDQTFAMDVNAKRAIDEIRVDDLIAEAVVAWPLPSRRATQLIADTLQRLSDALDAVDTTAHPGVPGQAWEVVAARTQSLLGEVPTISPRVAPRTRTDRAEGRPKRQNSGPRGGRFKPVERPPSVD